MAQTCNIASFLPQVAAGRGDAVAIAEPCGLGPDGRRRYRTLSYAALDARSDQIARGLRAYGIGRGCRTVLMVRPSLDFFALTFALFKAGVVPILIDPGLGRKQLGACLAEARPEAFIGVPEAHLARVLLGWARPTLQRWVTVGRRWLWGGATLQQILQLGETGGAVLEDTAPDELAAVLFTSGSTGVAKGVAYQHRHFVAQVGLIRDTYGIAPGEVDLPTFPLFALFDPALGMTTVVPQMDFTRPASVDPAMLAALIDDWQVTNVFGSPALLATVVRDQQLRPHPWRSVKRVISAGAPVPSAVLQGMARVLPQDAQVWTPYGATECLPVASIGSREVLESTAARTAGGEGVCVGQVLAANDVRIIAITDDALGDWSEAEELPRGITGEITVAGPTATEAYDGRPQATALAKIRRGDQVVHRMGDTGWIDDQGRLWYCGRKSHRVCVDGMVLHTAPVEEVFNTHPAVRRTALVGVQVAGRTEAWLCVEREPGHRDLGDPALLAALAAIAPTTAATARISGYLVHPQFPVDVRHNAKIGREQLAGWAAKQLAKRGPRGATLRCRPSLARRGPA